MDRFFRGMTAGMVGGVAMNLWTVIAIYILGLSIIRFIDWSAVILYGDLPRSYLHGLIALFIQIIFVGFLGVGFGYLNSTYNFQGLSHKGCFIRPRFWFFSLCHTYAL